MLYIIATPIGNLGDISPRALETLREADIIACEDTRRTKILLNHYEIPTKRPIVSYREQNEIHAGEKLAQQLEEGKTVALCSDGGYPGVSDPGYRMIKLAIERDLEFTIIPGASAVPMALLLSGLPSSSYTFKGFPPRKNGQRHRFFEMEKDLPHTIVIFESPFRVSKTLTSALEALGERQAAVCIELTKKFEKVSRGWLSDLIQEFEDKKIKGEVSIAIAGNNPKFLPSAEETI
ncbi:MAG: 16S rRNA (cytidine(1402)-2'-O)-methyltransferase [Kiritimatiellae bacterium]|nr:16S rRNA (cytidine(1402)-2'-O)-methyltransferase [Kiritimatiellia bacterium]